MSICWYKPCYGAFTILADKNPTATDYPVGTCVSPHGSSIVAETPNGMLALEHTDRLARRSSIYFIFTIIMQSYTEQCGSSLSTSGLCFQSIILNALEFVQVILVYLLP